MLHNHQTSIISFTSSHDSLTKLSKYCLHPKCSTNTEKFSVFLAGVDEETKARILGLTGFNKRDCNQLLLKITTKISAVSARHLSYAGQLQVINSVLFSLHNFWGSVFIHPQSIFKAVDLSTPVILRIVVGIGRGCIK
ncbi:hypothetical protein H5410_054411 [Solanum commersonii]|uniref:Uncharacterized protein n=1 Tax=Solanum commersonii TaxID=4109 RepID=A0A9J5WFN1_SOLCO|nr:hypothetical protein H5410_054411 [Solanum commersonii]